MRFVDNQPIVTSNCLLGPVTQQYCDLIRDQRSILHTDLGYRVRKGGLVVFKYIFSKLLLLRWLVGEIVGAYSPLQNVLKFNKLPF